MSKEKGLSFIESANAEDCTLEELENHFIPRFSKDNEPTISQISFIKMLKDTAEKSLDMPIVNMELRKSHLINGCIPEAMHKPAKELLEHEKVIRYDRVGAALNMSFSDTVNGQEVRLTVGGIKAYNNDNLQSDSKSKQHFQVFIGLQVKICMNLCIFTDGIARRIEVRTEEELKREIESILQDSNHVRGIEICKQLPNIQLTEQQVKNFIGNSRMLNAMPAKMLKEQGLEEFPLTDSQMLQVAKEYYTDKNFGRYRNGNITGWNFFNLLTQANKRSYIDEFANRGAGCGKIAEQLVEGKLELLN